jgi:hypothetical protein
MKKLSKTESELLKHKTHHKKSKKHKMISSLATNRFNISHTDDQLSFKNNSPINLSELPHFSFLSQNDSSFIHHQKPAKKHIQKRRKKLKNKSKKHEHSFDNEFTNYQSLLKNSKIKNLSFNSLENSLDSFLVYQRFTKNEEKCEISTFKTFCINSDQHIVLNSYHKSLNKMKHLIKSKNRAKYKLKADHEDTNFHLKKRNILLDISMSSSLLFNSSKNSYFIENNCNSDLGANSQWDQSLILKPFKNFIEILPGGNTIYFSINIRF